MPALLGRQGSAGRPPGRPGHRAATPPAGDGPEIGRPSPEMPELREWVIAFGDSGYVALYRHEPAADAVYVLAFRHQKEAGY